MCFISHFPPTPFFFFSFYYLRTCVCTSNVCTQSSPSALRLPVDGRPWRRAITIGDGGRGHAWDLFHFIIIIIFIIPIVRVVCAAFVFSLIPRTYSPLLPAYNSQSLSSCPLPTSLHNHKLFQHVAYKSYGSKFLNFKCTEKKSKICAKNV